MDKTERAALYKKWIIQMIDGAKDERLLKLAYVFVGRLFGGAEVKRA